MSENNKGSPTSGEVGGGANIRLGIVNNESKPYKTFVHQAALQLAASGITVTRGLNLCPPQGACSP